MLRGYPAVVIFCSKTHPDTNKVVSKGSNQRLHGALGLGDKQSLSRVFSSRLFGKESSASLRRGFTEKAERYSPKQEASARLSQHLIYTHFP